MWSHYGADFWEIDFLFVTWHARAKESAAVVRGSWGECVLYRICSRGLRCCFRQFVQPCHPWSTNTCVPCIRIRLTQPFFCVCECIYIHVSISISVSISIPVSVSGCIYLSIYTTHTHTFVSVSISISIYLSIHTHTHTHTHTRTHTQQTCKPGSQVCVCLCVNHARGLFVFTNVFVTNLHTHLRARAPDARGLWGARVDTRSELYPHGRVWRTSCWKVLQSQCPSTYTI
jgi:hypothetical protein